MNEAAALTNYDPVNLALVLALLALVPMLLIVTTSFLKIAVVLAIVRNALGIQQVPPNMALYALALILSVYIMAPVGDAMWEAMQTLPGDMRSVDGLVQAIQVGADPLREFLFKHSMPEHRDFFLRTAQRLWGPELAAGLDSQHLLVLIPSFLVSELTEAFRIGFLLYLPFVIIDLVVSNILLAMGMMMVSPVTISLPLKLFLFVMVDGWSRLVRGLVMTYT